MISFDFPERVDDYGNFYINTLAHTQTINTI